MKKFFFTLSICILVIYGLSGTQIHADTRAQNKPLQLSLTYYYYPYINYDYSPYNYSPYDYSPYSLPYGYSYAPPVAIVDTNYGPSIQKCRVQVQNQYYYGIIAETGGCRVNYNGRLMETHSFEVPI